MDRSRKQVSLVPSIVTIAILGLTQIALSDHRGESEWEYKVVTLSKNDKEATACLTELAVARWEFAGKLAKEQVLLRRRSQGLNKNDIAAKTNDLQGTWCLVSYEQQGEKVPYDPSKNFCIFSGDKWIIRTVSVEKQEALVVCTLVAFDTLPPNFVAVRSDGGVEDVTVRAIFELRGDSLKICYSGKPSPLPTEFSTKKGDQRSLLVYRRLKP